MKVILIVADTFRRDHLGTYGNDWIHTPNLDSLAARSAVFEHAYIGSFPTVPNRRDTFLGLGDKGVPFNRWKPIDNDEVTLPERLAQKKVSSMMVTDTAGTALGAVAAGGADEGDQKTEYRPLVETAPQVEQINAAENPIPKHGA